MVLVGSAAVISVEPEPDDGAGPFALKPLIDMAIDDVEVGVSQDMANMSAAHPSGSAELVPQAGAGCQDHTPRNTSPSAGTTCR